MKKYSFDFKLFLDHLNIFIFLNVLLHHKLLYKAMINIKKN